MEDTETYKFVILPSKSWQGDWNKIGTTAYHTFKTVWTETFSELRGDQFQFFSDDFTRQDFIEALFLNDKCVALDCIRTINLREPSTSDDSWFRNWNKDHLKQLIEKGHSKCSINSYFTVHPEFRKSLYKDKYHPSYVLGALSVLHQIDQEIPVMLGMMRNNRSMDKLGSILGSTTLEQNVLHNNLPSDLVAFFNPKVKIAVKSFPPFIFELFENKIDCRKSKEIYEKAA